MTEFDKSLSALGHFWPAAKPDNLWPGRVYIDTFPRATLHCIGRGPGDGSPPRGRMTIHGLTDGNQSVTMFEAAAQLGGVAFNDRTTTQRASITANYMLVASQHFDESPSVRRVSFASAMAEHVFRLRANLDYKDIRYRRAGAGAGGGEDIPIFHRQAVSYVDTVRGIRIRAFRPTVPNPSIEPTSAWMINFLKPATPREALDTLFQFRALLSILCGDLVELSDVRFTHTTRFSQSKVYFPDLVKSPTTSADFPTLPLLEIGKDPSLFRKVMSSWLSESDVRKIARGAFAAIMQDKGTMRFSHLRELVTIIEMQEEKAGTAPLTKAQARRLRSALQAALTTFADTEPNSAEWLDVIEKRIGLINSYDAKKKIANFIAGLPKGFVVLPDRFVHELVELRNTLVHDISRITANDQNKLSFFLAQLKALYALSDAMALGARQADIREGSHFLSTAMHMPINFYTGDIEEGA
jgi:ApeA N-terminal domain 1